MEIIQLCGLNGNALKSQRSINSGFPGGSDGKESAYNAGDLGSISELGRDLEQGLATPLQYSCLEKPIDRVAWRLQSRGSQRVSLAHMQASLQKPLPF